MRKMIFLAVLVSLMTYLPLYSQKKITTQVGDVKITQNVMFNDKLSVQIDVYDVYLNNAKGKNIYFANYVAQDAKWIDGTYVTLDPQTAGFDSTYWKGPLTFYYYVDYLEANSNINGTYVGSFFIKESGSNTTLGRKNTDFNVTKGNASGNTDNDEDNTTEADTNEISQKTFYDYWKENVSLLKNHPIKAMNQDGLKMDPRIPGEWRCYSLVTDDTGYWDNLITYGKNGTAKYQKVMYLYDQNNMNFVKYKADTYNFKWGVAVTEDPEGRPVTVITWNFDDGSQVIFYYALMDDGTLAQIVYNQESQSVGDRYTYYTNKTFTANASRFQSEIINAVTKNVQRQNDKLMDMMIEQLNNF